MNGPELYYAIMNILDFVALNHLKHEEELELYSILDRLQKFDPVGLETESIADANDCGKASTWEEIVVELQKQFIKGDRG